MNIRTRSVLLGTVLPLLLLAGAAALTLAWAPRLPDPVALHWGLDGVDRVGSLAGLIAPFAALAGVLCLPLVVGSSLVTGTWRRGVVGLSAAMAALTGGLTVGMLAVQLDVDDATTVASPGAAVAIPLVAALVIGILAAWLAGPEPALPADDPVPADAARLTLPDGGRAVWSAPLPAIPLAVPVIAVGVLLATAVALGVLTGSWWMLLPMALLSVVLLLTLGWRVQIDRTGLRLSAVLGWPRYRVPVGTITRADVVEIDPMREFGGWGVRVGRGGRGGSLGFVTRRGEGIAVERSGAATVVVTVDGAEQAAALLNTMIDRERDHRTAG